MTSSRSVKVRPQRPRAVAVIASPTDLSRALRLRVLPDFFELRLDALKAGAVKDEVRKLRAPLIITARHPLEGGHDRLTVARRRELLLSFLAQASFVDVELRSAVQLQTVLQRAREIAVPRIISVHRLQSSATLAQLEGWLERAHDLSADVFKVAIRTDTSEEVERLVRFLDRYRKHIPISAMGIGKQGRASRRRLARCGSALNYAHLGDSRIAGQLSFAELQRTLRSQFSHFLPSRGRKCAYQYIERARAPTDERPDRPAK